MYFIEVSENIVKTLILHGVLNYTLVANVRLTSYSISSVSVSFQSKWIYLGTKAGNVHIVNVESFQLSGYTIHWNKAIER